MKIDSIHVSDVGSIHSICLAMTIVRAPCIFVSKTPLTAGSVNWRASISRDRSRGFAKTPPVGLVSRYLGLFQEWLIAGRLLSTSLSWLPNNSSAGRELWSPRALALLALWELTSGQFSVRRDPLVTAVLNTDVSHLCHLGKYVRNQRICFSRLSNTIKMLTRILSDVRYLYDWTQLQALFTTVWGILDKQRRIFMKGDSPAAIFINVYFGGFYLQNPRSEAVGQPIVCQTSRLVIPRLCDIITNIWIMETRVFWLTQANARRATGWRRNSIPRYLNTSQLRVMYEGCVSYVYFRHFLRARIWMSSPVSRSFFSIYSGATPRASCESRDDLHFRKKEPRALLQVRWPISHVRRRDKSFFLRPFNRSHVMIE